MGDEEIRGQTLSLRVLKSLAENCCGGLVRDVCLLVDMEWDVRTGQT